MIDTGTPLRSEDVRQKNEKLVLRYIQHSQGISQSEVVQLTGLKAPTVLRIFSILEQENLIKPMANKPKKPHLEYEKKGRKPVYYTVNERSRYVIGVEFWSRTAHVSVVDFAKQPVYSYDINLEEDAHADEIFEKLSGLINQAIIKENIDLEKIIGIGIGAPGQICVEAGEVISYNKIPGMTHYPLGRKIEDKFGLPVIVTNNAGVIAMNAFRRGIARDAKALFTYLIRQGVGGAFIHCGKLSSILGKTAFEVGQTIVKIDGEPCPGGANGCLDAYAPESAILAHLRKSGFLLNTIEEVEKSLEQGDLQVREAIKENAKYLAVNARNIFHVLAPDCFLVITRFPEISKLYAEVIEKELSEDPIIVNSQGALVYHDVYNPLEAGFGACDLIFDHFFEN